MTGLYIHIPFCRSKCSYCGFYSVRPEPDSLKLYFSALEKEIRAAAEADPDIYADTVYFGGGTPSLAGSMLADVLGLIRDCFHLTENPEISVEMNPEDAVPGFMEPLAEAGFSRFTAGIQTFDRGLHREIGRARQLCTQESLESFFSFPGIIHCADLITGIPGQTASMLKKDLDLLTGFRPEHISAYLLTVDEGTALADRISCSEELDLLQRDRFLETAEILKSAGWERYEISNWCLPGFESRHNLKYWTYEPYLGFGPGAHSFFKGRRFMNRADAAAYIRDPLSCRETDDRSAEAAECEFIMTGLRLINGFRISSFEEKFGPLPASVRERTEEEIRKGTLRKDCAEKGIISLTEENLIFSDGIIYRIVQDLLGR